MPGTQYELSTETLKRFQGGSITIANEMEGYEYVGRVADLLVIDNDLKIRFSEVQQTKGDPGSNEGNLDYNLSLDVVTDVLFERTKLVLDTTPILWEKVTIECSAEAAATARPLEIASAISDEQLQPFVAGDLEVHAASDSAVSDAWRGPIAQASVVDNVLVINCHWMAFMPKGQMTWEVSDKREWRIPLADYTPPRIEPSRMIFAHCHGLTKGLIVLFAKGANLDPAKVVGLTL